MTTTIEKGYTVPVLGEGYCKFIYSAGTEEDICESARMSTGRGFISWDPYVRCKHCKEVAMLPDMLEWNDHEGAVTGANCFHKVGEHFPRGDLGFLEKLYSDDPPHIGPFEFCELVVEQQHPILVERQYARHRTLIALFSMNEFSARYAVLPDLFYVPSRERLHKAAQGIKNRQGSEGELPDDSIEEITRRIIAANGRAREVYEGLLGLGLSKELSRGVLGVFQHTKLRRKANLRNWLQAAELRLDQHAQWEAQETFVPIKGFIQVLWPRVWNLFDEYTLNAVRFSKTEIEAISSWMATGRVDGGWDPINPLILGDRVKSHRKDSFLKKLGLSVGPAL